MTTAYVTGDDDATPGMRDYYAYGYYATEVPTAPPDDDDDTQADCETFTSWVKNPTFPWNPRPAVLFLHGNQDQGSFAWAKWMAYNFQSPDPDYQPFVFMISAPGQGYPCATYPIISWFLYPECRAWNEEDQISVGQGMNPPTSWTEGFYGYDGDPPEPEHQILYGYTLSALRAVSALRYLFRGTGENQFNFVSDKLVIGGFSAGGVTSLLVNAVDERADERPNGVFALSAAGDWDQALAQHGNTMAFLLTADTYEDDWWTPDYSIDCASIRPTDDDNDDDASPPPIEEQKACQVVEYFDPVNFPAPEDADEHFVLLVTGAQDEVFPIPAFQSTFNYLYGQEMDVHRHLVADFDHKYYWDLSKALTDWEAYGSFDPTYESSEFYQFNAGFMGIRNFVQNVAHAETEIVPPAPVYTTMATWVPPGSPPRRIYRVVSCWDHTVGTQPYNNEMRFNISIDKGYHVLPACNNGTWSQYVCSYTINNALYDYNSQCTYSDDDDDDDGYPYNDKCTPSTTVSTGDILLGCSYSSGVPSDWTCRYVDVIFDHRYVDDPEHFMYWSELRYGANADVVVSSEVHQYGTASSMCLRPKVTNDFQPFWDLFTAMGAEDDDKTASGRVAEGGASCADLYLDSEVAFDDGDVVNYGWRNLVITANGVLVGNGHVQLNSRCDVVVEDGGRIVANNGSISIAARNTTVDGVVESLGDKRTGGITIVVGGDIAVTGEVSARTVAEGVTAGQVHLGAVGDINLSGMMTATGPESGGAASVYAGGDVTIDGAMLADSPAHGAYSGRIEVHSRYDVTIGEGAQLSTFGDLDEGQILIYYGENLSISDGAEIDTGDMQQINADGAAPETPALSVGAAKARAAAGKN